MSKRFRIGIDIDNGDPTDIDKKTYLPPERIGKTLKRIIDETDTSQVEFILFGTNENIIQTGLSTYDFQGDSGIRTHPSSATYPKQPDVHRIDAQHGKRPEDAKIESIEGTSLNNMAKLLKAGDIQGFFSIGDTAKIAMECSENHLGRMSAGKNGKVRPALIALMPGKDEKNRNTEYLFSDAGASEANNRIRESYSGLYNDEIRRLAHNIYLQGIMAITYGIKVMEIGKPKVGILCNGVELHKGDDMAKEADKAFKRGIEEKNLHEIIDYMGKTEPIDAATGKVDILLTDGFTGNIYVKTAGAYAKHVVRGLKDAISKLSTLDLLLSCHGLKKIKKEMSGDNPSRYGGAVLMGYEGSIVKGHGISDHDAIYMGIMKTVGLVSRDINTAIKENLARYSF